MCSEENSRFGFCIRRRAYFGKHLFKFVNVKHVIVLTSHLSLSYPPTSNVVCLHVGRISSTPPTPVDQKGPAFKPPLFHQNKQYHLTKWTHLDVTGSKSAHEAFMRLLTGKELVPNGPYTISVTPRDDAIIKFHFDKTCRLLREIK